MRTNNKLLLPLFLIFNCLLFSCSPDKAKEYIYNPEVTKKEKAKLETSFKVCPTVGDQVVIDILKPIREEYKLPGVAAVLVDTNGIVAVGAVGVRKEGTKIPVTLNDKWMIGSCTKAMTATLAALFIEYVKLKWDTTIGDVFSELPEDANPEFKKITLIELLSHHSGLQRDLPGLDMSNFDYSVWFGEWKGKGTLTQQRFDITKDVSRRKLLYKTGTKFSYSNIDYIVVGAMLEKISGKPFEELMKEKVLMPLRMVNSDFDRSEPEYVAQPWSHFYTGKPTDIHLPSGMVPAGSVTYCSISDWARFIQDQLRGAKGLDGLLKAATYKELQTPPFKDDWALGWQIKNKNLYHTGSDTLNFAQVYINVEKGYAVLFCTNIGFDVKNIPENDDDIPVVKAGNTVYDKLDNII